MEDALAGQGAEERTPERMKGLAGAGILAFSVGDHAGARARLEESVAIGRELGDQADTAYGLHFLEMAALYLGDHAAASRLAESVVLFRAAGDTWGLATALCSSGIAAIRAGDPAAGPFVAESLALARELGDAWGLARALDYAGELARLASDHDRARHLYEESLALYRELGHRDGAARVLHNLGYALQHLADHGRAAACFAEALALGREHGDRWNLAHYVAGLAETARVLGRPERAARLLGAAAALFAAAGTVPWPVDRAEHERALAAVRADLGGTAFAAAYEAGRALPLAAEVAEATEIASTPFPDVLPAPIPAGTAPHGLTSRELEVLRLLVEGRSDREIAAALFISPRTAMTHVRHIFDKLGVHSRRAARDRAIDQRLL